jgi:DNA-binding LacI/PurR family transcriptional regulator
MRINAAGGRVRQADIANLAGVSQATVSMVINNRGGKYHQIGEGTRRLVWEAVEKLGYVANPAARVLAGGRNSLVGVYTFEPVFPVDMRDFYLPFLLGVEEAAEASGLDLVLFTSASGPDRRRDIYRDGVNRLRITDGCVLLGRGGSAVDLARLINDAFPFVVIGRRDLPEHPIACVGADYAEATAQVVAHLFGLGHERIAYCRWPDLTEATLDREVGYRRAHERLGRSVDPLLLRTVDVGEVTPQLLRGLLGRGATAVIAQDAAIAAKVRECATLLDMVLPDELSLAVLGDPPRSEASGTDWTGFDIPRREMGAGALHLLLTALGDADDYEPREQLLPCAFHPGTTSVAPSKRKNLQ